MARGAMSPLCFRTRLAKLAEVGDSNGSSIGMPYGPVKVGSECQPSSTRVTRLRLLSTSSAPLRRISCCLATSLRVSPVMIAMRESEVFLSGKSKSRASDFHENRLENLGNLAKRDSAADQVSAQAAAEACDRRLGARVAPNLSFTLNSVWPISKEYDTERRTSPPRSARRAILIGLEGPAGSGHCRSANAVGRRRRDCQTATGRTDE